MKKILIAIFLIVAVGVGPTAYDVISSSGIIKNDSPRVVCEPFGKSPFDIKEKLGKNYYRIPIEKRKKISAYLVEIYWEVGKAESYAKKYKSKYPMDTILITKRKNKPTLTIFTDNKINKI